MKKTTKLKHIFLLTIIIICLMVISVFATSLSTNIDVLFNNISIKINGESFTPTDVNGNIVEPFINNGTTYMPVRAIANAFNKDISWEPEKSTITLTSPKEVYLDSISYEEPKTEKNKIFVYSRQNEDYGKLKNINHALELSLYGTEKNYIEYKLDKKYSSFTTTAIGSSEGVMLNFYGDNKLLRSTPTIGEGTELPIEVDVSNVNNLSIEIVVYEQGVFDPTYGGMVIFDNAMLLKK